MAQRSIADRIVDRVASLDPTNYTPERDLLVSEAALRVVVQSEMSEPTADEAAGMDWWNRMSEADRGAWLARSKGQSAADAWAFFKESVDAEPLLLPHHDSGAARDEHALRQMAGRARQRRDIAVGRGALTAAANAETEYGALLDIADRLFVLHGELAAEREENERLKAALREIVKCEGPYSVDRLMHANNTIENLVRIATEALATSPVTTPEER